MKLVNSHIIPKSLYGDALKQSNGAPRLMSKAPESHPKRVPNGVYSQIVCQSCEQRFSLWDNYANELLVLSKPERQHRGNGNTLLEYDNVDYTKLKLFFVSLLWRAHVSENELFKRVRLGQFAQSASRMIKENDPGNPQDFGVILYRFEERLFEGYTMAARARIYHSLNVYKLCFARHMAIIKVDRRPFVGVLERVLLAPGRSFLVAGQKFEESPDFQQVIETVAANPKPARV